MAIFNKANISTKHSTIIGTDAYIKGDLFLSSMIYIDGRICGNISSKDSVVIGKNGSIEGNIEANKVVINGKIVGNIDANNIEILAGAEFKGDMEVFELSCEASAKFMGHCKYREERKPENSDLKNSNLENSNLLDNKA